MEKMLNERIKIYDSGSILEITIPTRKAFKDIGGLIVLNTFVTFMMINYKIPFIYNINLFTITFVLTALPSLICLIWIWFGREIITVMDGNLQLEKKIIGYIGTYKRYELDKINTFYIDTRDVNGYPGLFKRNAAFAWLTDGVIKFDWGKKIVKFALSVDKDEAASIVELINARR